MRFYEFSDLDLTEDVESALQIKQQSLDNQALSIANRRKSLKNRKAQQANRETVKKLATNHLQSK